MYKTVRQGDASLQYTILPQVDQFYVNEMPTIAISSVGESMKNDEKFSVDERFRVTTSRTICLTVLIIAMFVCCAVGAYLIDEMINRRCDVDSSKPGAPLANGHLLVEHNNNNNNNNNNENKYANDGNKNLIATTTTMTIVKMSTSRHSDDDGKLNFSGTTGSFAPTVTSNFEAPTSETPSFSTTATTSTLLSSTEIQEPTSTTSPTSSSTTFEISTTDDPSDNERPMSMTAEPTNSIEKMLKNLKMLDSPRVTLKLTRITDTVPQMYLKPGIASYKNGKITTSVLSQGLTLEGLIFKTPDGTMNPWPEKWPFEHDEGDGFRRKGTLARDLTALALLMGIVVMLVLLVMVRSAIERWHKIQEVRTENRDEAHSTLLDPQTQDPEDKE